MTYSPENNRASGGLTAGGPESTARQQSQPQVAIETSESSSPNCPRLSDAPHVAVRRAENPGRLPSGFNIDGTANNDLDGARYKLVPLDAIVMPNDDPHPDDDTKIAALARSIEEVDQLHPIGLTSDNRLIYGRKRVAAHKRLGRTTIAAQIHNFDDLHRRMAAIDENIARSGQTILATCLALSERKQMYEAIHPETKSVTERGGPGRGKKTSDKESSVSFAKDAAARIRRHHRTVERMVEIGQKLDEAAAKLLLNTPIADKLTELKKLAGLPSETQHQLAEALVKGTARNVTSALTVLSPETAGSAPSPVAQTAHRGLKTLKAVVKALEECGIYAAHRSSVEAIQVALERYAKTDVIDPSDADEEVTQWRG